MVHVFNFKDNYYIFDTGSSSLHECDEKCALILREKLGENPHWQLKTVWGVGYKFEVKQLV